MGRGDPCERFVETRRCEGTIHDAEGRLVATVSSTLIVFPLER